MCGISIAKTIEKTLDLFRTQMERGLDSVGVVSLDKLKYYRILGNKTQHKNRDPVAKAWSGGDKNIYNEYAKEIMSWVKQQKLEGPFVLHHRKASMGSVSLENCHPFYYYKESEYSFFVLQNGTTKELGDYAKVMQVNNPEYKDKSDTWTLGQLICDYPHHKKNYIDMATGVKVIVDLLKKQIEIYGDKARSFYVNTEDKEFSSCDNKGEERDFNGEIVLDFNLNTLHTDYVQSKKAKYIQHQLPFKGVYGYDDDYGYGYGRHISKTHTPKQEKKETTYTEEEADLIDMWKNSERYIIDGPETMIKKLRTVCGNTPFSRDQIDSERILDPEALKIRLIKTAKGSSEKLELQVIKRTYDFYFIMYDEIANAIDGNPDIKKAVNIIIELYESFCKGFYQ